MNKSKVDTFEHRCSAEVTVQRLCDPWKHAMRIYVTQYYPRRPLPFLDPCHVNCNFPNCICTHWNFRNCIFPMPIYVAQSYPAFFTPPWTMHVMHLFESVIFKTIFAQKGIFQTVFVRTVSFETVFFECKFMFTNLTQRNLPFFDPSKQVSDAHFCSASNLFAIKPSPTGWYLLLYLCR